MRWIKLHFPKYVVSIIMLNSIGIYKYWDFQVKTKILKTKMLYILKVHMLYTVKEFYICVKYTHISYLRHIYGKYWGENRWENLS